LGDDVAPARAGLPSEAFAKASEPSTAVSLRWENDVLAGRDENYSNGISLALSHAGQGLLGGIWDWFGAVGGRRAAGYELGQIIVTPADISQPVPDADDRPYAGMLYGAVSTQFCHDHLFHGLKLITGVVGPASLAEETQQWVHRQIGSGQPEGWEYQLGNEPILNLVYEHRRRYGLLGSPGGWQAEAIPTVGGMLGNVLIQASAGAQFRLGSNLPDDYGTTLMRGLGNLPFPRPRTEAGPRREWGTYLFAGGSGNLVARNLSLDGSTFADSPGVEKYPAFAAAEFGVALWQHHFQATFSYVLWGNEFEGQERPSRFAAVTAAVHF
jgi:hypothetical protein